VLILTRREGEAVDVTDVNTGAHIATIRVMRIKAGGQVRLGFEAGPEVKFLRDDVKERDDVGR